MMQTGVARGVARGPQQHGPACRSADRLLNVHEAAALLAVKPATLYQWAYQRRIPVVKLMGRALRFRLSDMERLITQGVRAARHEDERRP